MTSELFTVEHLDGEMVDVSGDGGFSVFTSLAEAEDARDSEAAAIGKSEFLLQIVRYARQPNLPSLPVCGWCQQGLPLAGGQHQVGNHIETGPIYRACKAGKGGGE